MQQNIAYNILDEHIITSDGEHEITDGWSIYEEFSLTTLNRLPVNILDSWVTSRVQFNDEKTFYDVTPYDISESLIVDGTVVILDGVLMHRNSYLDAPSSDMLLIKESDGRTCVFTRDVSSWLKTVYVGYGTTNEKIVESEKFPEEYLYVYPNGLGIIYPHQLTFRELESMEKSIKLQTQMALSLIVSGYEGTDTQKTRQEIRGGARVLFVPGNGVNVFRVGDSNVSNQLLDNFNTLLPLYLKALHVPTFNENANESGIARQLAMTDSLKFVNETRMHLRKIWADIRGGDITFGPITILGADERVADLDYWERLQNSGYISKEELIEQVRATLL
jgi:hypothetical protein